MGVIHADLFPDNVFFLGNTLSGLIDFYFACTDTLAYDVAICLNAWCFEPDHSYNVTKGRNLLTSYAATRPLSAAELGRLLADKAVGATVVVVDACHVGGGARELFTAFDQRIENLQVFRVRDVALRQGILDRILNVGDVLVTSTDVSTPVLVVRGIDDPRSFYASLRELVAASQAEKRTMIVEGDV